ncbi:VOC family protein [Yeosuana marina]|uniref:VOC family protein n=1 Tax=Yeosuana marina TaxID=1565536 RepID=UPI0030EB5CFE|tara:strand:+ start:1078 stop:1491 length:414 start_codon:yes stop_codon:yes gene_type:complete
MDTPFHMSLPCISIKETKKFYVDSIGASFGRNTQNWIDINLFGHQITFIKAKKFNFNSPNYIFEGKILPSFHFGVIVDLDTWNTIYSKYNSLKEDLVTESTYLKDQLGEHISFFVKDPNGYMLEFKTFKESKDIFKA